MTLKAVWGFVVAAVVFLLAPAAFAQAPTPVTAATGFQFIDDDHTTLNVDGSPVVAHYEIRFSPVSASCAPVAVVNLGKPPQDAAGVILAKPVPALGTLPGNCVYTAVVAAIGQTGANGFTPEGVSSPSDPFVRVVAKTPAAPSKPVIRP